MLSNVSVQDVGQGIRAGTSDRSLDSLKNTLSRVTVDLSQSVDRLDTGVTQATCDQLGDPILCMRPRLGDHAVNGRLGGKKKTLVAGSFPKDLFEVIRVVGTFSPWQTFPFLFLCCGRARRWIIVIVGIRFHHFGAESSGPNPDVTVAARATAAGGGASQASRDTLRRHPAVPVCRHRDSLRVPEHWRHGRQSAV